PARQRRRGSVSVRRRPRPRYPPALSPTIPRLRERAPRPVSGSPAAGPPTRRRPSRGVCTARSQPDDAIFGERPEDQDSRWPGSPLFCPDVKKVTLEQAKRYALAAQGFGDARPTGKVGVRHFRKILNRIGVVQLDSVN